jgi:glycosyltransferase involved in cell wall biosynthesis
MGKMTDATGNPLVSIIVRTKDRPKLLRRALQSIAAQDYRPLEVVLVNDGGCSLEIEELKGILGDVSLNYIRLEKNTGRAHAGNVGIENVKGEYVGFLDDDDEYYPNHVVMLVSFLRKSDYEVAYTDSFMVYQEYNPETHELDNDVRKEIAFSQDFNYDRLVFENYIPLMCLMFGRKVLVTSGGFDKDFDLYEDWDLLIRIGKKYSFYHIKEVTANYNQWSVDFQISQANRDLYFLREAYLKVLSRHIKEITPTGIHGIISEYAHARQVLKGIRSESDSQKNLLSEREARINGLTNELSEREARIDTLAAEMREREDRVNNLISELSGRDCRINGLSAELQEKDSRIDSLSVELKGRGSKINILDSELRERDSRLGNLTSIMSEKEAESNALKNSVRERDALITAMKNTRGWRILEKYRKMRDRVFSPLFGGGYYKNMKKKNDNPEK